MKTNFIRLFTAVLCLMTAASCLKDDDRTIMLASGIRNEHIPSDSEATPNPDVSGTNTSIPNFQHSVEIDGGYTVIRIDMTGIRTPDGDYIRLVGTGGANGEPQNVWVEVDGNPKGIIVYNNADNPNNAAVQNDFVFLVDNSGSMGDEANAIARDIIEWAQKLNSTLDVRFGCVGYNGLITGGIDLTTYNDVAAFLNRSTGTDRTVGFVGNNASKLSNNSKYYNLSSQVECGMAALHFANDLFSFRKNANRIYVNFTDEPNYPDYNSKYSVHYLASQDNWDTSKGTIHTVYSDTYTSYSETKNYEEKPWRMSEYTGGYVLYANSSFSGVSLDNIPVTSAMQNSYIIKFTNVEAMMDGRTHTIEITIKSADGRVRAYKKFTVVFDAL